MPLVYGSSSNLLSIMKKSTASKALQVSTLFSCIVFLTKKEFFGTTQALSGLHSLFFNPSQLSNSGFQTVTFPFREGQLVILGWISQSIVLRFLPRCSAAKPLLPLPLPVGWPGWAPCAPHPQPCCSWGAVCNHGESKARGSLSHLHVDGQNPSASHDSHKS